MATNEHVAGGGRQAQTRPGPGGDEPSASGPHRAVRTVHEVRLDRHQPPRAERPPPVCGVSRPTGPRPAPSRGPVGAVVGSRGGQHLVLRLVPLRHVVPPRPAPGRPPGPARRQRVRRVQRARQDPGGPVVRRGPCALGARRRPPSGLAGPVAAGPGRRDRRWPGGPHRRPGPGPRPGRPGRGRDRGARHGRQRSLRPRARHSRRGRPRR